MPRQKYAVPEDDMFKINVIGRAGSGKTSLCSMLCTNTFIPYYTHSSTRESFLASMRSKIDPNRKETNQRLALIKKKDNTPLWSEKAWDAKDETLWTIFGQNMRPLSNYYVELTDIPGSIASDLTIVEKEYLEPKGLWNYANCAYLRTCNRFQGRYEPLSEDERDVMRSGSWKYRKASSNEVETAPLLPAKLRDNLPEPQKQATHTKNHSMNQLVEFARITMGFIVMFDASQSRSWEKARLFVRTIMEHMWIEAVRPPILVFANMQDKLRRNDAGVLSEAFAQIQDLCKLYEMNDSFTNGTASLEFAVGSVKNNVVSFLTRELWKISDDQRGKMPKLRELKQYTLDEIVHRVVSKKFDNSWDPTSSESKRKSGIVYQAYRHFEDIHGGQAKEDDTRVRKRGRRTRRGCLQSTWIWTKCIVKNIFCCPCNCMRGMFWYCTGIDRSSKPSDSDV